MNKPQRDFEEPDLFSAEFLRNEEKKSAAQAALSPKEVQQLALGLLLSLGVEAIAPQVPFTWCRSGICAAGFTRKPSGKKRLPTRTYAVFFTPSPEMCFNAGGDHEIRFDELTAINAKLEKVEAKIRRDEPQLAAADDLFDDFRVWNYAGTKNPEYHELVKKREWLLARLQTGSKIGKLYMSGMVDYCYLLAPSGALDVSEIPNFCGLAEFKVTPYGTVITKNPTAIPEVTQDGRLKFATAVAVAATKSVAFSSGIEKRDRKIRYRQIPRRRKKI